MRSLPYTSDVAALLHNELLLRVWAIPSYLISARAYQTYLQLSAPFQRAGSTLFVLRKDFEEGFWRQFLATLNRFPGFALMRNARLIGIRLTEARDRVDEILVRHVGESAPRREKVRSLIVAIPPNRLLDVVRERTAWRSDRHVAQVAEPIRPVRFDPQQIEEVRRHLERWAPLAARRSRLVKDDLRPGHR